MMTLLVNPSKIQGQDTIFSMPTYTIRIDTITKIDTTYIIDTIINSYTYIVTDTIYIENEEDSGNDFFLYNKLYFIFV